MTQESAICKNCGQHFEYERKRKAKTYCSFKCGQQYYNKNVRDKDYEKNRQANLRKERPAKAILYRIKSSANRSGYPFQLSENWVQARLDAGVCEATGLPLVMKHYQPGKRGGRGFFSPSVDRIDNGVGYIPSNTRLVCWGYNLMKNCFTDREATALSLATVLQAVPIQQQKKILKLLPQSVVATLPTGCRFIP
jgi:hypothetical protein